MTQKTAIEFEHRVAETIKQLNYRVTTDPLQSSGHSTWQDRIASWLTKPPPELHGPDMLVANGEKVVLVEAKAYPVLLGSIIQMRHYADYFEAPAIICVPDDAYLKIPLSVREWAEASGITLSPIAEIGDRLRTAVAGVWGLNARQSRSWRMMLGWRFRMLSHAPSTPTMCRRRVSSR